MALVVAMLLSQTCASPFVCRSGTQEVEGFLYLNAGAAAMDDLYINTKIVGYPGHSAIVMGNRTDVDSAAVILGNATRRDAGYAVDIRRGPDVSDRIGSWDDETGNLILACETNATQNTCSIVDGSGASSHVSLTCMPRYLVTIMGKLGENDWNTGLDGGCNATRSDGGCHMEFAALHGDTHFTTSVPRNQGGWLLQASNPVTDGTGQTRMFVDVWGGIGQRHNMIRAQFPKCPADIVLTTPQTQIYYNGAVESTMLYAFDEHRWYFCDGSDWQPMRLR